jgi:hypothetical protein
MRVIVTARPPELPVKSHAFTCAWPEPTKGEQTTIACSPEARVTFVASMPCIWMFELVSANV